MKTENLSIGLRALYHAIEWLTVFLILLIFAVQIITPLYAVKVGRADSFLQQLQWLPYRPGVLALGVMLAAVGTILSKCSHEVDSGFLSRSSWQLYLLEGVLYSASALIFQQNCDKIALFAIVDMVDDPRALRQKRFLSAMIVVYLFCNMDAATSALHAVTLKQYLAFYSLHTRSVLQLVIESLSALEMILFILYMVLFISQQTSEKQEILNLNQQLQQANEQLRIYAEESAHTAQVQERNRLAREIHDTLGHVLTGITAGADACIQMMDDSPEMARHQMELIADTARNGMNDVRRSVKALRPDSLEKENLSGALNKMCTSMAQSSGAQIQLEESLAGLTLSQDEEDCVYRTVQEGITNAIRHGHATRVQVRCHIEDGVLEVSVRDNYMVLFISQQTSEKQEILNLNQQLQQANEQLRIYAEESAHTAQVQERNRLAREIHDTLGHVLTGITAGADACIQMMDDSPEMARHQMELIADTARNGMNDVRRSVKALRPDSLEKENLSGALNKMCTSMAQSSGAQIQLEESLAGLTLSQDEEDCVYRTVQEGITNAIRHGHATRVQVRCHIEDGVLEVSVRDNGIGCKSVTPGFGLQHMQERMLMLGGTFWYENSDGFCIRAEIPLRKTPGSEKRKQEETV